MTEKTLTELGDKLSAEHKEKTGEALKSLKEALKGDDIGKIKKAKEDLQKVVGEAGASIYQQAPGAEAAGQEGEGAGTEEKPHGGKKSEKNDEDVVDADYEVEKEDDE
jgi:molecular chaperone DnaK